MDDDPKQKRATRRRNHIAKDLRDGPKYAPRVVPGVRVEDEGARRWRRYKELDELEE